VEILHQQIRQARRRLIAQSFTSKLAWCWFIALCGSLAAIGAGKFWPLADPLSWAAGALGAGLVAGLLAAVAWTWLVRQDALTAAVEIDRRFGLKERVSSALALAPDQRQSEVGQALTGDAVRRLEQIDLAERFGVRLDRRALLPLAPALAALVLALGIDGRTPQTSTAAPTPEAAQIKKSAETLAKKLEQKRKEAAEAGLPDANGLLKELEVRAKELAEKGQPDRKKTLVALNELVKEAEKRRQEVAGGAELKQQLGQLKSLQQGPAQKLGQALKTGDLQKAAEEVNKLREQLAGDKLSAEQKEQLAKQVDELRDMLKKSVEAQRQAAEQLKEQVQAARDRGDTEQADKLQQQLDKLAQKGPQMDKLAQMAEQLESAAQAMKQGQSQQAADALGKLSEELSGMQQQSEELEMLDEALAELGDAKSAMNCEQCGGAGCEACQGQGMVRGNRGGKQGPGIGRGRGDDERAEQKHNTGFYDSQVKQNVRKGEVVVTGTADGPNRKGQVKQDIRNEFSASEQQTAEALSGQRLPHEYRDHAKKYFDALRQGQRE
jgi:hypothetical protein